MNGREKLNVWTIQEYVKHTTMILIRLPIWGLQLLLCWIPIKRNRITVYSMKQHGYSCNLKYLTEYLKQHHPQEFEILWIVKKADDFDSLHRKNIPVAMVHSWTHFFWRMQSGIVITNDEFYPIFRKRCSQIYVNIWHGGINYKKIGYEGIAFTNSIQQLIYRMNNPCPDYFVSGSRSFTETTSRSFRFPKSIFLESGLPRNDILCNSVDSNQLLQIRHELQIPEDKKIVLYAPTFRKGGYAPQNSLDYNKLIQCLQHRFGGEWIILLRQHYFVNTSIKYDCEYIFDVSRYEDMQQLLLCSDCMISDYSSCMWDYLLTEKPCFVYAPDLSEYQNEDRSFFILPKTWPYPIGTNPEMLYKCIEDFDADDYKGRILQHKKIHGSFDKGNACKQLYHVLKV